MPFTAGVSVERCLNKHFSLEAGLQYNCLDGDHTLHTLGIPVRLNMMLASTPKVDFYAMVGGAARNALQVLRTMVSVQSRYSCRLLPE